MFSEEEHEIVFIEDGFCTSFRLVLRAVSYACVVTKVRELFGWLLIEVLISLIILFVEVNLSIEYNIFNLFNDV